MSQPDEHEITRVLEGVGRGDPSARERLLALVYDELHGIAAAQMGHERADHTLQPTALVHEAYLRLFGTKDAPWDSRAHFFSAAAEAMRRILVDHARARMSAKRGGGRRVEMPQDGAWTAALPPEELLAIDEALEELAAIDARRARLVKLRFFGGLEFAEIGAALGLSRRTIHREWRYARAWLFARLSDRPPGAERGVPGDGTRRHEERKTE